MTLSKQEINKFLDLFCYSQKVLDFSTTELDIFTGKEVGISICEHYGLSKIKSLKKFCDTAEPFKVQALLFKLFEHAEKHCNQYLMSHNNDYQECLAIYRRESDVYIDITPQTSDKTRVLELIENAKSDLSLNKTDSAITKIKTILEESFKIILKKENIDFNKSDNIGELFKKVRNLERIKRSNSKEYITKLFSGISQQIQAISELRNDMGDAHGHGCTKIQVSNEETRLFLNISISIADYFLSFYN